MKEIKSNYNLNRLIIVADKGLNSTNNINYIINNSDGYVVSQILRGKKGKRYQDKLFDESDYIYNSDKTFKHKLFQEDYEIVNKDDKKERCTFILKKDDADIEAKKRECKLSAERIIGP